MNYYRFDILIEQLPEEKVEELLDLITGHLEALNVKFGASVYPVTLEQSDEQEDPNRK